MQQIQTTDDIKKLGTILSVWAHPDDESYLAAGIMAAAVVNGQKVICVTATKGEAGVQDPVKWPPETLGETRAQELKAALKELGVEAHHWLGYGDGHCEEVEDKEAVAKLKEFIDKYQPDTILTFGPEGLTGHPDHAAVSRWSSQAVKGNNIKVYQAVHTFDQYERHLKQADQKLNIFFNIDKPPLVQQSDCAIAYKLPAKIADQKCDAVAAMPSQTKVFFDNFGRDYIKDTFATEYFVLAKD